MSLKAKMQQREAEGLPTDTHPLRFHNDKPARAELAAAVQSGDEARITAAKAALEACYVEVTIQALEPDALEKLIGKHPPTEAQEKRGGVYNPDTFPAALLAACLLDSDITEEDWLEYLNKGPLSAGEGTALFNKAWAVNYRAPDPWIPKEWTETRS